MLSESLTGRITLISQICSSNRTALRDIADYETCSEQSDSGCRFVALNRFVALKRFVILSRFVALTRFVTLKRFVRACPQVSG